MRTIPPSELMVNADGSIFHLHLHPDQLADTVVLVGDPGRAQHISTFFNTLECRQHSREFVSATGTYRGARMTVLSTGIGTDNIDIVVNELDALANIDLKTRCIKANHRPLRLIRLGTSGALQADIPIGSMVLSTISIGLDGLLHWYAGREKVCLADYQDAFVAHMHWPSGLPLPYFVANSLQLTELLSPISISGMTVTAPGFYGPQGRVLRLPLIDAQLLDKIESFRYRGDRICNFEMEGSAIAGLSALLGHQSATICLIIANRYQKQSNTSYSNLMDQAIEHVLDKLADL